MRTTWAVLLAIAPLLAQNTEPSGRTDDAPSFVQEITIHAPISEVWKVWTTGDGYKAVGVAKAEVDFRVGGIIRSHYSATGILGDDETIENQIMAYEPQRMIAIRIAKPPKSFPFKEAWKTMWTVVTLTDLGSANTHIRVASMGYGSDQESASMLKFFEAGNGTTLRTLQQHFESANPSK